MQACHMTSIIIENIEKDFFLEFKAKERRTAKKNN